MERREVISKGVALQKALGAKEPTGNIINILRDLQKNVKPTDDLLRATQIGKIVNRVKTVPGLDPSIPRLASEIINEWKTTINKQRPGSGAATPNGTASPTPKPAPAEPTGVPPDKRNWKVDKVSKDSLTDEPGRNNTIGLLYDGLCLGSELPMKTILNLAKEIEAATYALPQSEKTHTSSFYKDKIRSLFQNLKNKSNPQLRKRILSGEVSPQRFVVMSHEEMKSKEQRKEEARIAKENMDKAMVAQEEKSVSTSLECGKCHQKKVSYSQAQTRSADEPMTTFCECMNCGNRWKFS